MMDHLATGHRWPLVTLAQAQTTTTLVFLLGLRVECTLTRPTSDSGTDSSGSNYSQAESFCQWSRLHGEQLWPSGLASCHWDLFHRENVKSSGLVLCPIREKL